MNEQLPEGPIISLKPGPTLASEAAEPDKEVIKSCPSKDNKRVSKPKISK